MQLTNSHMKKQYEVEVYVTLHKPYSDRSPQLVDSLLVWDTTSDYRNESRYMYMAEPETCNCSSFAASSSPSDDICTRGLRSILLRTLRPPKRQRPVRRNDRTLHWRGSRLVINTRFLEISCFVPQLSYLTHTILT
jgi:hypothetical protein